MKEKNDRTPQRVPDWLQRARSHWKYNGEKRPPFADDPKDDQRSVWDFPRPPALEKTDKKFEIRFGGTTIASSDYALAVLETASPPTYYIPPENVDQELLTKMPGKSSLCEWKGKAEYWTLKNGSQNPVAWSYSDPFPPFEKLKHHLAFYPQHLECFVNGERVVPQPGEFYAGWSTGELCGPFKGEPGSGHW
ncbi:MAG: DUF427 domain-containing protein [Pricia sp.]